LAERPVHVAQKSVRFPLQLQHLVVRAVPDHADRGEDGGDNRHRHRDPLVERVERVVLSVFGLFQVFVGVGHRNSPGKVKWRQKSTAKSGMEQGSGKSEKSRKVVAIASAGLLASVQVETDYSDSPRQLWTDSRHFLAGIQQLE